MRWVVVVVGSSVVFWRWHCPDVQTAENIGRIITAHLVVNQPRTKKNLAVINQPAGHCFQIKSRERPASQQDNLDMEFLFKMKKPQITVF